MAKPKQLVFKVVISDPKTGKAIQVDSQNTSLIGKKIGDIIDGSIFGLDRYKLQITGGSGFEGAPMVKYVEGSVKKYVWWKVDKKTRVKKLVRGNTISNEITQINTKIYEYGQRPFEDIYNEWKQRKGEQTS